MQSDLMSIEQLIRSTDLQPLSLNVPSSPSAKCQDDTDVDEDPSSVHESTPIKPQALAYPRASKHTAGLLAYSTPVIQLQQQQQPAPFTSLTNKSSVRKPRVNFHSIDDIVNSKGKWSALVNTGQHWSALVILVKLKLNNLVSTLQMTTTTRDSPTCHTASTPRPRPAPSRPQASSPPTPPSTRAKRSARTRTWTRTASPTRSPARRPRTRTETRR